MNENEFSDDEEDNSENLELEDSASALTLIENEFKTVSIRNCHYVLLKSIT